MRQISGLKASDGSINVIAAQMSHLKKKRDVPDQWLVRGSLGLDSMHSKCLLNSL